MRQSSPAPQPELIRGVGLAGATTLNMIDMIGVGPFITLPLIVTAAGGPQAMLGWIAGAVLALCDGLIWAELGAAMPSAGGSYRYLKQIYGPKTMVINEMSGDLWEIAWKQNSLGQPYFRGINLINNP